MVSDPYLISTPDELNAVRNYLSSNFELESDIDLTAATSPGGEFYNGGAGWVPIGPDNYTAFTGIFNGNGKTIKGLNISTSTGISSYCTYTVTYTDKAGNKTSSAFTINNTASVITAKIPSGSIANNAYTNASVTVTAYGYNVSKSVTKSGSSFTYPSNGVFTADGKYIVTAKVGSNTATFTFTVDKTAPVITGVSSGATYSVIKKITFNEGTATLNGAAFTSGSIATKTGTNTLVVTDKAGNSATASFTLAVNVTYTTYNISLSSLATDNAVAASYVDPNVLAGDPADAYEFMSLKWVDGITADDLTQMLTGRGVLEGHEQDFLDAARQYNINPVYLIAHARIETANGTSPLSIGQHVDAGVYTDSKGKTVTVSTDGTYYNLFGIHAYNGAVVPDGSQYAASQGWDSVTAAIYGGRHGYLSTTQPASITLRIHFIKCGLTHMGGQMAKVMDLQQTKNGWTVLQV